MSTYEWNNPVGGSFDDAGNWLPDTAFPGPSDTADFLIAGTFTVFDHGIAQSFTISDDVTFTGSIEAVGPPPLEFTSFLVSGGTAIFDGGTLNALTEVMVGDENGAGLLAFIDGASATLTATDSATALDIGYGTNSGSVSVDGASTTLTILGGAYVGVFSSGTLSITDGALVQDLASTAGYNSFEAGSAPGSSGTILVDSAGTLTVDEGSLIGASGTGVLTVNNGATSSFYSTVVIGSSNTGVASFDNGAIGVFDNDTIIGDGSTGSVAFADGATGSFAGVSATAAAIYLGGHSGSGTLTADGTATSIITGEGILVGQYGDGLVALTDGATLSVNPLMSADGFGSTFLGDTSGASGTVTVDTGATLIVGGGLYVGEAAAGVLSLTNGATGLFTDYTTVGDQPDSSGTLSIASGATATFDGVSPFDGGGQAASIYLGAAAGARGVVAIDGPSTNVTADQGVYVGFHGDGTLQLTNGAVLTINPATIGGAYSYSDIGSYGTGTLLVSGGAQIAGTGEMFVGSDGYGSLDLTSGAAIFNDAPAGSADAGLGQLAGAVGVGTIDRAVWDSDQSFFVGFDGSGTLTVQDNGVLSVGAGFLRVARDYGSTGTLTVDDASVNAGNAVLTVGPDNPGTGDLTGGTGTLELQDGGHATFSSAVIAGLATGFGSLDIRGSLSELYLQSGSLTTGAGTSDISVESNAEILANGAVEIGGGGGSAYAAITDDGDLDAYGGVTVAALGTLAIDPTAGFLSGSKIALIGGTLSALGDDSPGYAVEIAGGTKSDPSAITGTSGADMLLSQGVTFASGASAALLLTPAFDTSNVITNFASGDLLDVQISPTVFNTASYDTTSGDLTLSVVGDAPLVLHLANNGYRSDSFSAYADGSGGTDVVLGPPCYVAGTRILTDHGEVAVEDLAIGDRLITRTGAARPLRWIGIRSYDPHFAAANPDILPVLIRANAIAPGIPRRDLYVSPRHAMYLDGMLIPGASLVNGTTIVRMQAFAQLSYFHLELATHDIIVAEGALSETYIDLDNRNMFHNASEYVALYGPASDTTPRECALRCEEGVAVAAIRSRLADRAAALGYARPRSQTVTLRDAGIIRVRVAAGVTEVHLHSPAGFVARDRRRLGALLRAVRRDGIAIALTDPALQSGFHEVERHVGEMVRWTNGDAVLTLPLAATDQWIEIDVAAILQAELAA